MISRNDKYLDNMKSGSNDFLKESFFGFFNVCSRLCFSSS